MPRNVRPLRLHDASIAIPPSTCTWEPTPNPRYRPAHQHHFTAWHEVVLHPGEQYTVFPGTKHWFHAPDGAIVSEFSTHSRDDLDIFTDPAIQRATKLVD